MRIVLLSILTLSLTGAVIKKHNYTVPFATVKGDLNKDKIADLVIITQDTLQQRRPYKLEVYFIQPNGTKKLIVSTTKALEPQFIEGENTSPRNGPYLVDPVIKKGVLWINHELLRGHFEHKWRYQNGNFELIGYSFVESNGVGLMYTNDFNLSTGEYVHKEEEYSNDKVVVHKKQKHKITPLPKLQDFELYENDLY
ncbi:MAG TPA: hypothetical protein VK177_15695 [Flavobacteriales bacterium]|nr:hypothetical protein [Flavobacteriales bacterium]